MTGAAHGADASTESDGGIGGPASREGIIENETGAQRLLGYVLDVGRGDGRAHCSLAIDASHANRHGMLHGGLAALLLDNAMGATASLTVDRSGRRPFLTIALNTQFLAPGRIGSRLTATGRVSGGGRSLVFVDGELVDEAGTRIATASGVFKRAGTVGDSPGKTPEQAPHTAPHTAPGAEPGAEPESAA